MEKVLAHAEQNLDVFIEQLKTLLRFESISAAPEKDADCVATAEWLAAHLGEIGMAEAKIIPTTGKPLVYGFHPGPAGAPTVLIYGHYDVQPVDPLELWDQPPFAPTVHDGKIWGRGTSDDKGQLWIHIKAIETLLAVEGALPVSVKLLLEGEEEVGSVALSKWLPGNLDVAACDLVVVSDSALYAPGRPSLNYGLRGLSYFQVEVEAAAHDLHSGSFGGAVANPINVLAGLLATMHDEHHRVAIAGFYDEVIDLDANERAIFAKLPGGDAEILAATGAPAVVGEAGYTTAERLGARPTLDANGVWGGFAGEGAKTVLPAKAGMKVSMRLVPNQDPKKIGELFRAHVAKYAPPTVRVKVTEMHGGHAFLCPLTEPALQKAAAALREEYGVESLFTREGGSIPVVADMAALLKKPVVLMGFGLNSEQAHAPNEHFDLGNFRHGIRTAIRYFKKLGG